MGIANRLSFWVNPSFESIYFQIVSGQEILSNIFESLLISGAPTED
jgi:hypothetical protein